jgi:hypothetical protein
MKIKLNIIRSSYAPNIQLGPYLRPMLAPVYKPIGALVLACFTPSRYLCELYGLIGLR